MPYQVVHGQTHKFLEYQARIRVHKPLDQSGLARCDAVPLCQRFQRFVGLHALIQNSRVAEQRRQALIDLFGNLRPQGLCLFLISAVHRQQHHIPFLSQITAAHHGSENRIDRNIQIRVGEIHPLQHFFPVGVVRQRRFDPVPAVDLQMNAGIHVQVDHRISLRHLYAAGHNHQRQQRRQRRDDVYCPGSRSVPMRRAFQEPLVPFSRFHRCFPKHVGQIRCRSLRSRRQPPLQFRFIHTAHIASSSFRRSFPIPRLYFDNTVESGICSISLISLCFRPDTA